MNPRGSATPSARPPTGHHRPNYAMPRFYHVVGREGFEPPCGNHALFYRQARQSRYPAPTHSIVRLRGQGSNLRSPGSEPGVLPSRLPRSVPAVGSSAVPCPACLPGAGPGALFVCAEAGAVGRSDGGVERPRHDSNVHRQFRRLMSSPFRPRGQAVPPTVHCEYSWQDLNLQLPG